MEQLSALTKIVPVLVVILVLGSIIVPQAIRILREYERGVIFRLGKLLGAKGPGLILLIPIVDKMVKIDLRVVTIDVPKQEGRTATKEPPTWAPGGNFAVVVRFWEGGRWKTSGKAGR